MLARRRLAREQTGMTVAEASTSPTPVLRVDDLIVDYRVGVRKSVRAVAGVSFDISAGRVMALIGESGSGKSTIARAICGLGPVKSGSISFADSALTASTNPAAAAGIAGIQIVFQDSTAALDPRWPVWRSIVEPRIARMPASQSELKDRAVALLARVGLSSELAERRPSQM
jgi:peptide/nickel transport system ATP-binding protein